MYVKNTQLNNKNQKKFLRISCCSFKIDTWTCDVGSCFAGNADHHDFEVRRCQMDRAKRNCFQIGVTTLENRDVKDRCPEKRLIEILLKFQPGSATVREVRVKVNKLWIGPQNVNKDQF